MEIIVYEMKYTDDRVPISDIVCIPFKKQFFQEYMGIYNQCFYEMRKALGIQPYNFLNAYEQIADKIQDIYLLTGRGEIIGSVACYGNEIDDLIVNPQFPHPSVIMISNAYQGVTYEKNSCHRRHGVR